MVWITMEKKRLHEEYEQPELLLFFAVGEVDFLFYADLEAFKR